MKTLVVRLDHLGDLLLTTPLIRALARGGHSVDVLGRGAFLPIFENSPHVRHAIAIEDIAPKFPMEWWKVARWMRVSEYDIIILAYARDKRLCLASAFSGTRRRVAMWGGIWGRLTFHQCLRSEILTKPRPFSQILLRCADAVGIARQGHALDFFLTESERVMARSLVPLPLKGRTLVGIHPGSNGNTCNLPSEVYGALVAHILAETDWGVIITGTQPESALLDKWPMRILDSERVWNAVGRLNLRQLAGVIAEMSAYVCSGTGPLHVASAMGTPTVSPTCPAVSVSAAIWGNFGAPSRVIEPAHCPRMHDAGAGSCAFRGQIGVTELLEGLREILSGAANALGR